MARPPLCLRLPPAGEGAAWCAPGEAVRRGPLAEAAPAARGRRLWVLVPTEAVLLTRVQAPTRRRSRLRQAVPYLLEERLAQDVEALHFALGRVAPDGGVPVAVVERRRLEGWLGALAEAGLRPQALLPDALALPWEAGRWTVALEAPAEAPRSPLRALVREGREAGWAAEAELLPALLAKALARAPERPEGLRLLAPPGAPGLPALPEGPPVARQEAGELLPLMAAALARSGPPLDLLQGPYGAAEDLGRLWRPWRAAAALAGLALAGQLALAAWEARALEARLDALQAEAARLLRSAFPEVRRVVAPRVQMERRLQALRAGARQPPLLLVLDRLGEALAAVPRSRLEGLRYREGELRVSLRLPDLQALERLKGLLARGLEVEVLSADSGQGGLRARLRLRRAA
ncbi:MAG: type II secretion system protein GspL [Gammaproteobacteria bacterium]|nr:MAG: type II secretion system protein GspL [Gammaproteobacteria bacterium]